MALDNANFIAELSITDPPGSDPLSQGDDQIRTIKRATFQSFPLIAAAVNITDVQMNLMAIKNEENIFTVTQHFNRNQNSDDLTGTAEINFPTVFSAGTVRWQYQMAANRDLRIRRFDVLGALVDDPWTIDATTGIFDFAQVPTVQGAPLWIAGELRMFVAGVTIGANWFLANGLNGTVDLANRSFIASGTSSAGTFLAANLNATAQANTSGSTALTEAQMPAHNHTAWITNNSSGGITDININTSDNVFGGRRNDASKQFSKSNGTRDLIGNAGSGSGHTHTTPATAVDANSDARDSVRAHSFVAAFYQYVP